MNIYGKLDAAVKKNNSLLCVGLDSEYGKLPRAVRKEKYPQFAFNKAIIDATARFVCAFKPNIAFYEARGVKGLGELKMTIGYINEMYPEIVTICDAKRADIGNTNKGYVSYIFDELGFDAVTLHPYLGREALAPFLSRKDKASIILCRTSNAGAGELQDLTVDGQPLYLFLARTVAQKWNGNGNCMLVVGATYPEEMKKIREAVGTMPFLVPGIGAQGGDVEKTVLAGMDANKGGMMINSSRGIIFASTGEDFAARAGEEAQKLRDGINKVRGLS